MSWSASDKLLRQIQVEIEQLSLLLNENMSLIDKCGEDTPSKVEVAALAAFLHSFYTGIENIFGRIYVEMHGKKAGGEAWHKVLLMAMTEKSGDTDPVISRSLCEQLNEYLTFRHVFRQAYTFEIRWEKMKPLVIKCAAVFKKFSDELSAQFKR